eukprot:1605298-Alexandrium_andersonii.AAC.1
MWLKEKSAVRLHSPTFMVAERRFPTGVPYRTANSLSASHPPPARCPEVILILPPGLERARSAAGRPGLLRLHHRRQLHQLPHRCPLGHWERPVFTGAHL